VLNRFCTQSDCFKQSVVSFDGGESGLLICAQGSIFFFVTGPGGCGLGFLFWCAGCRKSQNWFSKVTRKKLDLEIRGGVTFGSRSITEISSVGCTVAGC